ncbi:MAG TPA: ABC transporter substrate-binding protein [Pusillimonas sp.]|uniref:ABC transporter substrate-binding protein n=1 Tax=Pusillimonas sp. TaxID=3040095 RepID=UPI002B5872F7|nr:ABC transporter substrate-binding protein [Pusillimonas sp.]HUH86574.1 ABC transporter substrate-binding protein [Pusillimonas sp.]
MKYKMLFAGVASVLALAGSPAGAEIKIGFSGPLSGPGAALGQDQYDGLMLAIEQNGGKLGGQPVTVIKEDDQLKPEVGVQIARKLIERDHIDALVGMGYTNILMAQLPQIVESGVVALSTNSGARAISGEGCKPNIFGVAWQSDGPAESMGVYAQKQGYGKVFLMAPNYQAGKEMLEGFKRHFKGEVVEELYTQLGQTDYSAEIVQLQTSKADALFVFYPGGMGINFVKQMRQAGMLGKLPVLSVFTVDGTTLPALKGLAEGVIAGAMWSSAYDNPQNHAFVKAFQQKYNRTPSMYAAAAYDAGNLLNIAAEKLKGDVSDKKAFAQAVKAAGDELKSVRGPFKFNNNHMPIQNYYAFQAVKTEGDNVVLKQIDTPLEMHQDIYHSQCPMS